MKRHLLLPENLRDLPTEEHLYRVKIPCKFTFQSVLSTSGRGRLALKSRELPAHPAMLAH